MNVLIIGASGLVGGQCFRVFSAVPGMRVAGSYFSFALPHLHPLDTLRPDTLERWSETHFVPDWVIQCGALTHVDYCEQHPEESYRLTVLSNRQVLNFSKKIGARVVLFSTDYVFDGRHGPYQENDPVNPLSVYGRHKLQCEEETLSASDRNLVLRITNVYGDEVRGKNFVARIINQIREGQSLHLRLPVDQYATPANAADIAAATLQLVQANAAGIYHLAGTDLMNRVELALTVLHTWGYTQYTLEALPTSALQQPAPRPLFGGLVAHRFKSQFPTFEFSSVRQYVQRKRYECLT
jgi:dTDP-4-dehydrorhamnose reductase